MDCQSDLLDWKMIGQSLDSYQKILSFIRSIRTQTCLSVTAGLDPCYYSTGSEPPAE